jgi:hypothetical protein
LTVPATSISGTQRPQLNVLEPTTKQPTASPTATTISPNSLIGFKCGERSNSPDPANLVQQQQRQLPTAEEIQGEEPPKERVLTMTNEEFFQWRQILGAYKKQIQSTIQTVLKK